MHGALKKERGILLFTYQWVSKGKTERGRVGEGSKRTQMTLLYYTFIK